MQRVFAPVIAETAIAMMLGLARGLVQHAVPNFREKKWEEAKTPLSDLLDKTLGLVGLGGIGCETARRVHYGFGMRVLAVDPKPIPKPEYVDVLREPGWLMELVPNASTRWRGRGTAFRSAGCHVACTLAAWWAEGREEPWFILTDLAADGCDAAWYGLRTWCEQGFRCTKRGGWQWQHTRTTDPGRAARVWLALAIANLWMVTLGSQLETGPTAEIADLPDLSPILASTLKTSRRRRIRLFRLGWLWLLVQLITAQPLPLPRQLVPEPWPEVPEEWNAFLMHQDALSHATA
jgi:hypothetical protein